MMPAAPLLPDNRVGAYVIDRVLGQSGYAVVYAALRASDGLAVAIKEFLPTRFVHRERDGTVALSDSTDRLDFDRALAQFVQQGESMSRCEHPNLVKTHEVFAERGTAYIVMNLVHGQRLSEAFKLMMLTGETQLNSLLVSLGSALHSIHEKGLVHGYVQPRHIILTADESPVLLDFAGARRLCSTSLDPAESLLANGYAAPEQYTSDDLGPSADIYGLGAVLYCAVAGEAPVDAPSRIIMQDRGERIRSAVESASGLFTRKFLGAIDSALVLDAKRRTQGFPDWGHQLEQGAIAPEAGRPSSESSPDFNLLESAPASSEVDESFIEAFQSRLDQGARPDLVRRIGSRPPQSAKPWRWVILVGIAALALAVLNDPLGLFLRSQPAPEVESAGLPEPAPKSAPGPAPGPMPGRAQKVVDQKTTPSDATGVVASVHQLPLRTESVPASSQAQSSARVPETIETVAETPSLAVTPREAVTLPAPSTLDRLEEEAIQAEESTVVSSLGSQADEQSVRATAELPDSTERANPELTDAERKEIDELLVAAREDIKSDRLTSPAGRNAFERLSKVLRIDPDNEEAKAGLDAVVERYIGLAKRAHGRGDAARVTTYLDRAERVLPGSKRTAAVRVELGRP